MHMPTYFYVNTDKYILIFLYIYIAYERKAPTYEDLLELTCAIEEEFVFAAAPSRLDYFKSGNYM